MSMNVVLVRTEYSSNVGASARAAANMGADRLILIDPRCDVDNEKARQMAAGAQDMLAGAVRYTSWNDFFAHEGQGVRIALSRRGGRKRKVFALEEIVSEKLSGVEEPIYFIFGPEADGLDADDLAFVNFCCSLPVYGEFGSLNLAQAVLLALFLVKQKTGAAQPDQIKGGSVKSVQPFYFPDQLIKDWLTAMGFNIRARKASAYLTLRRLFLQNQPTEHEIHVLESILQQNIRKLKSSVGLAAEQLADDLSDIARQ